MISMIRNKLFELMSAAGWVKPFISVGGLVIAIFFFMIGLLTIPNLLLAEKFTSMPSVWTLMVLSFLSGLLVRRFHHDAERWGTNSANYELQSIPYLLGIGVFFVILLIQSNFDFRWYFISQGWPQALMAWGVYALIIQLPWSCYLTLIAGKRETQSVEFVQYAIEVKRNSDAMWVKAFTVEDINSCSEMMKKYHVEKEAGNIHDLRMVEEEGIRQVRVTF